MLKVLIIGDGNAGAYHRKAYLEADCEIVAQTGERDDYRRYIREADVVSIASPDRFHFEQACEAIRFDKHVFVEKPPCTRTDELTYLMNHTAKINFACNLPLPWSKEFVQLGEAVQTLGKVYLIEAEYNYGRRHKLMEGWRASADYSMVFGAGLHMIDLILWYMGEVPTDGSAFGVTTTRAKVDTVQAVMKFKSGAIGRLGINGGYDGQHEHVVKIYGDKQGVILKNTEEVDKTVPIKEFVKMCAEGRKVDNARLWNAMQICFQIESQMP